MANDDDKKSGKPPVNAGGSTGPKIKQPGTADTVFADYPINAAGASMTKLGTAQDKVSSGFGGWAASGKAALGVLKNTTETIATSENAYLGLANNIGGIAKQYQSVMGPHQRFFKALGDITAVSGATFVGMLKLADQFTDYHRQLGEAIAQSGLFSGAIANNTEALEMFDSHLGATAASTGQSFQEITKSVSTLLSVSSNIAQTFAPGTSEIDKSAATFDQYSKAVKIGREAGMAWSDTQSIMIELFKQQNITMDDSSNLIAGVTKSLQGSGTAANLVLKQIQDLSGSYKFLTFDANKTGLVLADVAQKQAQGQTTYKNSQAAVESFAGALQGMAAIANDTGKAAFYASAAAKPGGPTGLEAAQEFEYEKTPEQQLETTIEGIKKMQGGKLTTYDEAKSSGLIGRQKFETEISQIMQATGIKSKGEAKDFLSLVAKGMPADQAKEAAKATMQAASSEAVTDDGAYQQNMLSQAQKTNEYLGDIRASLGGAVTKGFQQADKALMNSNVMQDARGAIKGTIDKFQDNSLYKVSYPESKGITPVAPGSSSKSGSEAAIRPTNVSPIPPSETSQTQITTVMKNIAAMQGGQLLTAEQARKGGAASRQKFEVEIAQVMQATGVKTKNEASDLISTFAKNTTTPQSQPITTLTAARQPVNTITSEQQPTTATTISAKTIPSTGSSPKVQPSPIVEPALSVKTLSPTDQTTLLTKYTEYSAAANTLQMLQQQYNSTSDPAQKAQLQGPLERAQKDTDDKKKAVDAMQQTLQEGQFNKNRSAILDKKSLSLLDVQTAQGGDATRKGLAQAAAAKHFLGKAAASKTGGTTTFTPQYTEKTFLGGEKGESVLSQGLPKYGTKGASRPSGYVNPVGVDKKSTGELTEQRLRTELGTSPDLSKLSNLTAGQMKSVSDTQASANKIAADRKQGPSLALSSLDDIAKVYKPIQISNKSASTVPGQGVQQQALAQQASQKANDASVANQSSTSSSQTAASSGGTPPPIIVKVMLKDREIAQAVVASDELKTAIQKAVNGASANNAKNANNGSMNKQA